MNDEEIREILLSRLEIVEVFNPHTKRMHIDSGCARDIIVDFFKEFPCHQIRTDNSKVIAEMEAENKRLRGALRNSIIRNESLLNLSCYPEEMSPLSRDIFYKENAIAIELYKQALKGE